MFSLDDNIDYIEAGAVFEFFLPDDTVAASSPPEGTSSLAEASVDSAKTGQEPTSPPKLMTMEEAVAQAAKEAHEAKLRNISTVRFTAAWTSQMGSICDLDLHIYCYDDKGRFLEKLDFDRPVSEDRAAILVADEGGTDATAETCEIVTIEFPIVKKDVAAYLLYLDGDSRNFQLVNTMKLKVDIAPKSRIDSFVRDSGSDLHLFSAKTKCRRDFKGLILCSVYRDRYRDSVCLWSSKCIFEPVFVSSQKMKDEMCHDVAVKNVPALEKFKPRTFPSVRMICGALSSQALPKLKIKFQKGTGLPIEAFVEALFLQLKDGYPKLLQFHEAAYTVAMLEEMFYQIDFNGDGDCSWEEFTNFAIQAVLSSSASTSETSSSEGSSSLNEYVIEYSEDISARDTVLSQYRTVSIFKYEHSLRKILLVQDDSKDVLILNENFEITSKISPNRLKTAQGSVMTLSQDAEALSGVHVKKYVIYDVIYVPSKDMYCYCSSDHVIGIVKEHVTIGGNITTYSIYNKIFHNQLHVKLCYSEQQDILCTVSSSNVIFGWNLDGDAPLFNISRHNDIITDFISCEDLGCFATCSMDKRIVLWSSSSRRVKGVFLGHKRGVRHIQYSKQMIISCAFETDARIWDMNTKDCAVILRGHRSILSNAVLMCDRARDFEEYRALTVDESGEFRLWNIYVREKTSEPYLAPTIQVFESHNCEVPICNVKFFALPNHQKYSTSYYSDIIACSTKLLHFLPQKNSKEFIPPSCMLYNDPASTLVTGVGSSICKYDICTGQFLYSYIMHKKDVTAIALDGDRGRKLYMGIANGDILTINFVTGDIVAQAVGFHFKDITKMICLRYKGVQLFTCSLDGKMRMMEEISGDLHIKYSVEDVFGDGVGIGDIAVVNSLKVVVAISKEDKYWGIWNSLTFKQTALFQENDIVTSFAVLGASGDKGDKNRNADLSSTGKKGSQSVVRENMITIAIVTSRNIRVYTIDITDLSGALSMLLTFPVQSDPTSSILFKGPPIDSVNFALSRDTGDHEHMEWVFAVATEDGMIYLWDASHIRRESERYFYRKKHRLNTPSRAKSSRDEKPRMDSPDDDCTYSVGNDSHSNTVEDAFTLTSLSEKSKADHLMLDPTNTYILTYSFGGADSIDMRSPRKHWKAHADSISKILCLGDNGCIQTTSHDGYQRCWNVDGECLGELLLPNVTDKMLSEEKRTVPHTVWKFILEKIPIQAHHEEQARAILAKIAEEEKRRSKFGKNGPAGISKFASDSRPTSSGGNVDEEIDDENKKDATMNQTQQDIDRAAIFEDLSNPPKERDDAPPQKIPTRQELKIMKQVSLLSESRRLKAEEQQKEDRSALNDSRDLKMSASMNDLHEGPATSTGVTLPDISESPARANKKKSSDKTIISKSLTSLWAQPEIVFDHRYSVSTAFSNDSLGAGFRAGMFDKESLGVLRKLAIQPDKVAAFDHMHDAVFLRSSKQSTKVDVPKEHDLRRAEVLFGSQKDMYKNADAVLRSKDKPSQANAVRSIVAMARIEQNLHHVGHMVHVVKHGEAQKEIDLPDENETQEKSPLFENHEDTIMELRLLKSASMAQSTGRLPKTDVDEAELTRQLNRVEIAMQEEDSFIPKRKRKKKSMISVATRQTVEKKLRMAIIDIHNPVDAGQEVALPKKVSLTTRQLLPYYKVEEVRYYMDVFSAVDSDFSGDLDINEWVKLFTSMDQSISPHQARMIFMQLDKSGDGILTSKDLIPIIFNKASREQLQLILMYVQSEIIQKRNDEHCLKPAEVAQLFECYDSEAVGFVPVSMIRDKIRSFLLPESAHFGFMESISKLEEDEMLNELEFTRVLKPYSIR